ncbi:MAG TPA: Gfo/Idh/MocA family oxidoreductase [Kiritimatiellia bacterium]|nr:Gfo/Idh/MocA family oxidoreductase [Kiritimatiellia bacterium]HMO98292.1 Gfo/Idh/MocA family oxidoreductase [Kiritimatiellia bacterium]
MNAPGVGIIGCGLIGGKRAAVLGAARLVACADPVMDRAQALAKRHPGCQAYSDPGELIKHPDVSVVIIATPNNLLAPLTRQAIESGKHVLVEKPAALNSEELAPLIPLAAANRVQVRVGFNHRYHPSFRKARELLNQNALGPLMFLRARYGHGGRVGYDREWRADPKLSGGGELIDQGIHLIDLSRWLLGELELYSGFAATYFWDMPVDDNAFMMLKGRDQRMAFLHVSCTEWKNLFSLELYGKTGKLHIEGLGGSYGVERINYYRMLPEMGPPETTTWEFPRGDDSWAVEWAEFMDDIQLGREPSAGLPDALAALGVVRDVYERRAPELAPRRTP